ncbi:FecR domain-containing protein [Sphingobacterium sp. DN00404]|uniref:FecR domain-containing protein n=1 Tax=Sphingobacterium micropteri TaxID=2763501 RepID=A0ABR7YLB1_9SPHI|nr:FecR domain-containing protein [Sphingobacterium micropteri]MBD1432049.1 FecR domain-containing protein [Sphingobacterium micropteri]
MSQDLQTLLQKYTHSTISNDEYQLLKAMLKDASDKQIEDVLSVLWHTYEHKDSTPPGDFEALASKLGIRKENRIRPIFIQIAKIAAIFILFIFAGYYVLKTSSRDTFMPNRPMLVEVRSGEKAEIILPDGSKVFLNAASTLSYAPDFGHKTREVTINGEAYLEVAKDEHKPFLVHTESIEIEVLGTKFNVNAYDDLNTIETTLLEGSVRLRTKGNEVISTVMTPYHKVIYDKEKHQLSAKQTNTEFETAWTRGELVLRSSTLHEVINKLEKRYGVDIEIIGDSSHLGSFTGSFKEDNVYKVLDILSLHYNFTIQQSQEKINIQLR